MTRPKKSKVTTVELKLHIIAPEASDHMQFPEGSNLHDIMRELRALFAVTLRTVKLNKEEGEEAALAYIKSRKFAVIRKAKFTHGER